MITVEALVTFLTASVLLGLVPGPDNIFVAAQSAVHGRHAGIFVVLARIIHEPSFGGPLAA